MKLDIFKSLREREKHITRLHIILFSLVVVIGIVVLISLKFNKSRLIEKYKDLEKDLNTATIYYYKDKEDEIEKGQMKVVRMSTIIDNGYLQDEITKKCDGYTLIINYRTPDGSYKIAYNSYIKCGKDYQTVDFTDEYLR